MSFETPHSPEKQTLQTISVNSTSVSFGSISFGDSGAALISTTSAVGALFDDGGRGFAGGLTGGLIVDGGAVLGRRGLRSTLFGKIVLPIEVLGAIGLSFLVSSFVLIIRVEGFPFVTGFGGGFFSSTFFSIALTGGDVIDFFPLSFRLESCFKRFNGFSR